MTSPRSYEMRLVRALLATIAVLLGVIAALVAGILRRLDGGSIPQAIEYGWGGFAATVLFTVTLFHFLSSDGRGNVEG